MNEDECEAFLESFLRGIVMPFLPVDVENNPGCIGEFDGYPYVFWTTRGEDAALLLFEFESFGNMGIIDLEEEDLLEVIEEALPRLDQRCCEFMPPGPPPPCTLFNWEMSLAVTPGDPPILLGPLLCILLRPGFPMPLPPP